MATLDAPAKLTTSLRVVGIRRDGFHLIDAEMVSLDFGDEVRIEPHGEDVQICPEGQPCRPAAADDLVRRALAMVERVAAVRVLKRIPVGAGLGGGSADAAAILRWAGWTDVPAAARLGADVPFCLLGGRARVGGVGEQVDPLSFEPRVFTLLTPPVSCSTPEVYRMWDELGGPRGPNGNDLEPAALRVAPELSGYRDRLASISGSLPRLAGSGSTWFVEGEHPGPGLVVARARPPHSPPG